MTRADGVRVAYPLFQAEGGGATPTSALQLRIEEIPVEVARELNRRWHSALPRTYLGNMVGHKHCVFYSAEFHGIIYAVAMWTDPIAGNRLADGDSSIELRRLAIAPDAPRYTASRMLAIMAKLIKRKWPEMKRAISYQAEICHKGTIYKAAGWKAVARSESMEWSNNRAGRSHRPLQLVSAKVRWELAL